MTFVERRRSDDYSVCRIAVLPIESGVHDPHIEVDVQDVEVFALLQSLTVMS